MITNGKRIFVTLLSIYDTPITNESKKKNKKNLKICLKKWPQEKNLTCHMSYLYKQMTLKCYIKLMIARVLFHCYHKIKKNIYN